MRARTLGAAALTLAVCACGGIQVNSDYNPDTDFTRFRTYAWAEGSGSLDDPRMTDLVDQRFRRAVESELVSRGWEKTASAEPDVFVGYQIPRSCPRVGPRHHLQGFPPIGHQCGLPVP